MAYFYTLSACFILLVHVTASSATIQQKMLLTYFDGVTEEIANQVIQTDEERAALIELLKDDNFPRQDNTVTFMGYLGNDTAADALAIYWNRTKKASAEERRAFMMVLHSLGLQAQRGVVRASYHLNLLMQDADDVNGHLQRGAALHAGTSSQRLYNQLVKEGLFSLAMVQDGSASNLLDQLCLQKPAWCALIVRAKARAALFGSPTTTTTASTSTQDGLSSVPKTSSSSTQGPMNLNLLGSSTNQPQAASDDASFEITTVGSGINTLELGYCQHIDINFPLQDADVDALIEEATNFTRESAFAEDVSCCLEWRNGGDGGSFGSVGDGLDVVSDEADSLEVFNQNCGRVKVVDAINFCGGAASNVIGCAPLNSDTMMVVQLTSPLSNAKLWVHEAGHNAGLDHNPSSPAFVMFATLSDDPKENIGLTDSECSAFLNPNRFTGFNPQQISDQCPPRRSDFEVDVDVDDNGGSGSSLGDTQAALLAVGAVIVLIALVACFSHSRRHRNTHQGSSSV
eukprot:m.70651 g.70651  ORF g.70651 m.70651 type:complete len:514 (+) comp14171_c0_seq2:158-1699(+)